MWNSSISEIPLFTSDARLSCLAFKIKEFNITFVLSFLNFQATVLAFAAKGHPPFFVIPFLIMDMYTKGRRALSTSGIVPLILVFLMQESTVGISNGGGYLLKSTFFSKTDDAEIQQTILTYIENVKRSANIYCSIVLPQLS